jgi:hypothetical protein
MRLVGIVASSLVSGNYYNRGGAGDIEALKTSKSTQYSVRTSQRTPRACIKSLSIIKFLNKRKYIFHL